MSDRIRRNGQLSSCEPCRKSKLRCDHGRPTCGRCARRRLPAPQCHYHPAPMAKQPRLQRERVTPAQSHVPSSVATDSSSPTKDSRAYEPINMNRHLMCFADPNTPHSHPSYTSLTRTGVALPRPSPLDEKTISDGARLLNDILELLIEIGEPLERFSINDMELCFHGPLLEVAWNSTNNTIRSLLDDRSEFNLNSVSQAVFERTSSPPIFPPTAAAGALESIFSVRGLRWEVLGLYCAQIGLYLGGEKDKSFSLYAHQGWKSDRKTLMQRAFKACIQCESFCDQVGAINDLTLWFTLLTILFATWAFGDDSYHALRLIGNMTSVFIALGFHRGVQNDPSIPLYMVETRKRAIAWAHDLDKVCAGFTSRHHISTDSVCNRPVRLSRHFCAIELPLDIEDSVLMGPTEGLLRAVENLDADGWSKEKAIFPVSRQRAQLMLGVVREEALELKLGPEASDLETKAGLILQKLELTWQAIPSHLKCDSAPQYGGETKYLLLLLNLRLEYLYTEFLLYSLLARSSKSSRQRTMITAHEIVNLVLLPTRNRDLLHSHRADMEWTLVFYAMPCASVLTLELLRQDQSPEERLNVNRSGIIQDISVLISCCDFLTESGQSNYQICKQAQSIFSKSLDSILNRTDSTQRNSSEELTVRHVDQSDQHLQERTSSMSAEFPNIVAQDPEWMAWLDSLGLQGDPWLESIIPTLEFPMNDTV
ncbi:hypothetical protein N7466_003296 [Penicillium verhagenii]|uniref:uncharacterized protein n=1 Tax=Penicillium verhagenii TaxID=1562060 RepID=UPI0025450A40|nr:uncharacterized protein N7466_003296 [Penicillium verhagenii]KAJ5936846.1 hypothetical protein N7466_003296 [Penicillium verhagenii]